MASTRLTIQVKNQLVQRLLKHAFGAPARDQLRLECELALDIYDHVVDTGRVRLPSGKDVKLRDALDALPRDWGSMQRSFQARMGHDVMHFDFTSGMQVSNDRSGEDLNRFAGVEESFARAEPVRRVFKPGCDTSTIVASVPYEHDLTKRADNLTETRKKLLTKVRDASRSARATMDSVSTIQRLIVVWPEVEAFAALFMNKDTAATAVLPVIRREALNDALGLPPGTKEFA